MGAEQPSQPDRANVLRALLLGVGGLLLLILLLTVLRPLFG